MCYNVDIRKFICHSRKIYTKGTVIKMIWLKPCEYEKQKFTVLRLYAPENEKIFLDFEPLKFSDGEPLWEDWHCYAMPLRIFKQDYELLLHYFNRVFPVKDPIDGNVQPYFDVCSDNMIGADDWLKIICEIERDMETVPDNEKAFLLRFVKWLREALKYTSVIVAEGNL